ncbi:MAG: hypothetical protein KDD35_01115 [Bdellovibrionales bacterium]|nr:hypothetical protein [Bdellovibrionales bacterium]
MSTLGLAEAAEELQSQGCFFGGGTAIVLSCGEYRESINMPGLWRHN